MTDTSGCGQRSQHSSQCVGHHQWLHGHCPTCHEANTPHPGTVTISQDGCAACKAFPLNAADTRIAARQDSQVTR